MSSVWNPTIIIGLDFGMTCTGVAYSKGPDWADPKCIQDWPEVVGNKLANKVATQVGYDATGRPRTWGFLCDGDDPNIRVEECFKLYLDPNFEDRFPNRPSTQQAKRYFKDYMTFIYGHVDEFFRNSHPRWDEEQVEFLFSVPTTWKNPNQSAEIERLINEAGFGGDTLLRRVKIAQTEAEAAAIYAAKGGYKPGDVILVCDAGGGTTDVNILKLTASGWNPTEIKALTWAEGRNIGSVLIDMDMEKLVTARLARIPADALEGRPSDNAQTMMKGGRFERFKCAFGSDAANVPSLRLPVPGLTRRETFGELDITNGAMVINMDKLEEFFDEQFGRITALVDEQIRLLATQHPQEHLSYMVLSGGLGSSPYIQRRLKARYGIGAGATYPHAQGMQILLATQPQLAVVQGVVMDRVQALSRGTVVYKDRCCRLSFGVVSRVPYDPIKHRGEKVDIDPFDGKKWAEGQIDWLIKQGETISKDGISVPYKLKIPIGKENDTWQAQIVTSGMKASRLPQSMSRGEVEEVCRIESRFDARSTTLKNRHWYNLKHQYSLADFDVKVIIGPADLKFQLVTKSGEALSDDHDEIEVKWEPPKRARIPQPNVNMFYREL